MEDSLDYKLDISRVRVDLGNDTFVDAETPLESTAEASTIPKLVDRMIQIYSPRNMEIVDVERSTFRIDTTDLTIDFSVERSDGQDLTDSEAQELSDALEAA